MWNTRSVQLNVRLPQDVAAEAEAVQAIDPDFLSRIVLYGFTRRTIYRNMREQEDNDSLASPEIGEGSFAQPETSSIDLPQ